MSINENKELNIEISLLRKLIIEKYALNRETKFWDSLTKSTPIYKGTLDENFFIIEENDNFGNFEHHEIFMSFCKIQGRLKKISENYTQVNLTIKLKESLKTTLISGIFVNIIFALNGMTTIVIMSIITIIFSYFFLKRNMKKGFQKFVEDFEF